MRRNKTPSKSTPARRAPTTTPRRRVSSSTGRQNASEPSTPQSAGTAQTPKGTETRLAYKPKFPVFVTESICCSCAKGDCGTVRCNCVRNGIPCDPTKCKCSREKCTNIATRPEDAKLRYSALKRPLRPDASQGDVNLIERRRTPYKRFHRSFMVDIRVEVRYQNRRNIFIVPSDTLFSQLAVEAATFYGVISDKDQAGSIVASLFDYTGAVCPPNTKIALMTVMDSDHPLVLRCRRARRRPVALDDEDNFIAGRADDAMDEESMMRDGDDGDEEPLGSFAPMVPAAAAAAVADVGTGVLSQHPLDSQDYPGILHSGNSQVGPSSGPAVPHCHVAGGSACEPGCLFVIAQGSTMLGCPSHPFADDRVVKVCDDYVLTENGNLYLCRVDKNIVTFVVPPEIKALYSLCGEEHKVQCAASTDTELIVIIAERLYAANKATGTARLVLPDVNVASVSASREFAVAIDFDGAAYVWGETTELGVRPSSQPTVVSINQPVQQAACGLSHVILLTRSGELYAFGRGDEGRLGFECDSSSQYVPKKISAFMNERNEPVDETSRFVCVACGRYHSAAVTEDGALYTWGGGKFGQLGLASQSNQTIPRRVFGLSRIQITKVACEVLSTAACDARGNVWTFGFRMTSASDSVQGLRPEILGGYSADVLGCIPHFTLEDQHISQISASETGFFLAVRGAFDARGENEANPISLGDDDDDIEL